MHARRERAGPLLEEIVSRRSRISADPATGGKHAAAARLVGAFELGRPFGPPTTRQSKSVSSWLRFGMLVEDGGPVRIIDFPDETMHPRASRSGVAAAIHAGDGRQW